MSEVGKVYRVTVRYPYLRERRRVKYGSKQVVSQTWSYYLMSYSAAQRRARHEAETAIPGVPGKWDEALANAMFKVEVAPSAVFRDISDIYDVESALEAKERLRTIDHAG